MNIRNLKYLIAVAETNHFGKAAERCFVSQPTLSGQIKKLEEELGVTLFERTKRSVSITPVGEEIVWANPDTGNSGTVTPMRDGTSTSGKYCREFRQSVMIGGEQEEAYGVACRQPDGSWQVVQ